MGLNKSVNDAFRADFIGYQLLSDIAIDGITLRFFEGAALNDGNGSAKSEDVADASD